MEGDLDQLVADGAALGRGPGAAGRRPVQRAPVAAAACRRAGRARPVSSCCATRSRSGRWTTRRASPRCSRTGSPAPTTSSAAQPQRRDPEPPARTPTPSTIEQLQELAADRARELGSQVAQQQPAWATKALGAVPADAVERLEWEAKAGAVAAYREAAGFEDAERALPSAPGLTSTEKRAAWWNAWDALGRPSETRAEAALTDGQLRARVTAWQREQQWAPAHADASMRDAELRAEQARTDAILAEAAGDTERAAELRAEAERLAAVARGTSAVADARAAWAAETAVTRDLAERAERELDRPRARRPAPRTTGSTPRRGSPSTGAPSRPRTRTGPSPNSTSPSPTTPLARPAVGRPARPLLDDEIELRTPSPAHDVAPVEPDDLELAALVHTAAEAEERIADRESQEAAHDGLDAELGIAPELGRDHELDLGDEIELPAPPSLGGVLRRWPDED